MTNATNSESQVIRLSNRRWVRVLGWVVLLAVLGLGLLGYVNPSLKMNWETLATMCGF
ncbi:hypothetical protein [Orrella sp. 11846]|uniref:hypothetical protein n=1 Tax=Orrella sp. 11846 TaxID=3409913 RepID=UPI003B5ADE2C